MTRRVVTHFTHVVFLAAVHGDVSLQQRLATEVASAVATHVAAAVEDDDVVPQRSLVLEGDSAAFEPLLAVLMHRCDVPLQVVLSVGHVATLRTPEQLLAERVVSGLRLLPHARQIQQARPVARLLNERHLGGQRESELLRYGAHFLPVVAEQRVRPVRMRVQPGR